MTDDPNSPEEPGYGPEVLKALRGLDAPIERSSVERGDEIDWSRCPDVESIPGRCGGQPVAKGTRIPVEAIIGNFEAGCSAEEIAGPDIFDIDVETVRRILVFAAEFRARTRAMTDDNELPYYFSGQDELSALLLAMVMEHCTGHSPEKTRQLEARRATYLSPDPSPGEWLDSYNSPANADAMCALADQGLIEIAEHDGAQIRAKVAAEGRTLLEHLHLEQERNAAASWRHRRYLLE